MASCMHLEVLEAYSGKEVDAGLEEAAGGLVGWVGKWLLSLGTVAGKHLGTVAGWQLVVCWAGRPCKGGWVSSVLAETAGMTELCGRRVTLSAELGICGGYDLGALEDKSVFLHLRMRALPEYSMLV